MIGEASHDAKDRWVRDTFGIDPRQYASLGPEAPQYPAGEASCGPVGAASSPPSSELAQLSNNQQPNAAPAPADNDDDIPTIGIGPGAGRGRSPGQPGNSAVTPEVAAELLRNITSGKPPFRPELGKVGGVSWFVTAGNPHTGPAAEKSVPIPVEVQNPGGKPPLVFGEQDLLRLRDEALPAARALAEQQSRQAAGLQTGAPLNASMRKSIERNAQRIAERQMWTEIGRQTAASESGIGKVELKNSAFSRSGDGEFTLTSRPEAVQIKGGPAALLKIITNEGVPVEAPVLEAAEALAAKAKWGGRVRGAFRVGGRVMIVVGVAVDAYQIYTASDKAKAIAEVAGGWTAATLAGTAFAEAFAPADFAGPVAWAIHGVGTLVVGGVAYYIGSSAAKTIYELTIEGDPILVGGN